MRKYKTFFRFATEEDFKRSAEWLADFKINEYNDHGLIRKPGVYIQKDNEVIFAIYYNENKIKTTLDIHIGNIALTNINWIYRHAEFSCVFNKTHWGKGIGFGAAKFLFGYGFYKLNLNRIWLGTCVLNKGMIKIAEKLKMKPEGILKEEMFIQGNYIDVVRYGLLKEKECKQ